MPKLFLIRHAIAEDREDFKKTGLADDERPLTVHGKKRMHKIAKKLHALYPEITTFLQSPLVRSQQTTQILRRYYSTSLCHTIAELSPGASPEKLLKTLKDHKGSTLAVVGHEPNLSHLLQVLISHSTDSDEAQPRLAPLKKGGIACLDNSSTHSMRLLWLVTPKIFV